MKIKIVMVGMVLMMAAVLARGASGTNDLAGALRNGLFEEQVDHNLEAAIATYQSVVTKFDTDRQLAATAAFRLGECYRTLGRTNEAVAQYERVVKDFPDQGTLVKLSEQSLTDLNGRPAPPQPPTLAPSPNPYAQRRIYYPSGPDSTNDFNAQLQTIIDASKSQQSQDELAKLRMTYAGKQTILARLKDLNEDQLKQQLPSITSDAILIKLLEELLQAQQNFLTVKGNFKPENPSYQNAQELIVNLDEEVAKRIRGVLASLETELAGLKAQIDQASVMSPEEQVLRMEFQRQSSSNPGMSPKPPGTNFGDRVQAIINRSMTQESQDELAKLRTAYAGKQAILARLKETSIADLKQQLPTIAPDAMLMSLMGQLNVAEQKLQEMKGVVKPEHPSYQAATALVDDINERIINRIRGILESMSIELVGMKAQMDQLEGPSVNGMRAQSMEPVTDEEEQEITRIRAMIQNSPDLINAANGAEIPLILAAQKDYLQVARFLLEHGADVNRNGGQNGIETPLVAAAENGHKKMVELLLENGAEVNARAGYLLRNPLNRAVAYDFQAVAEVLLAHGADPNLTEIDKETPLARVATHGSVSLAELLVAHGADVNATNASARTPLHIAAGNGNAKMVSFLLEKKAAVKAKDKEGKTPLFLGIKNPEVVKILLANGAEVNARDNNGETVLMAAASGPVEIVKILLEAKADVNLVETDGNNQEWAPLHFAVDSGSVDSVEALLSHGANPNVVSQRYLGQGNGWLEGTTPLMLAIENKRAEVVRLLLRYKANPNLANVVGTEPLQEGIGSGDTNIVDSLLRNGADVNKPLHNLYTPLQWAVADKDKAVVETVLAYHPDVNAVNVYGFTAVDVARDQPRRSRRIGPGGVGQEATGESEISALLHAHGALDTVPKYDVIQVSRPAQKFTATVFRKGTNDWNHYTLLELLAVHYGFISTTTTNGGSSRTMNGGQYFLDVNSGMGASAIYFDKNSWTREGALTFPNLEGIKIWRSTEKGAKAQEMDVNLAEMIKTGDCTKDMELKWGDVVEIPEMDHPMNVAWDGFSADGRTMLMNCLKRGVQLTVKGQTTNLVLVPKAMVETSYGQGPYGQVIRVLPSFFIGPVLNDSKLLRTSSDLTRVKVTRMDVQSGMKLEWTVDCSDANNEPDLWLRDGDMVEVGER